MTSCQRWAPRKWWLGCRCSWDLVRDIVVRPKIAYPTYDIGAQLVGATPIATDDLSELTAEQRAQVKLIWVNSPGNPTGKVLDAAQLAGIVAQAREMGAVVASDECYAELGWDQYEGKIPSILDPEVNAAFLGCGSRFSGSLSGIEP